jgi:hypothetical protein
VGLTKYAVAIGVGYALGRPDARRRVGQLRGQLAELARHPKAKQLKERARGVAGAQALAAKHLLKKTSSSTRPADTDESGDPTDRPDSADSSAGPTKSSVVPSNFQQGTTGAEDSQAVIMGIPPLPRPPSQPSTPPESDV